MNKELEVNELLKALENKTIKVGTKLRFTNKVNGVHATAIVLDNPHNYILQNVDFERPLAVNWLIGTKIELIENEIDIQEIEEINIDQVIETDDKSGIALLHINKLIKAVKQLDNKIQEN